MAVSAEERSDRGDTSGEEPGVPGRPAAGPATQRTMMHVAPPCSGSTTLTIRRCMLHPRWSRRRRLSEVSPPTPRHDRPGLCPSHTGSIPAIPPLRVHGGRFGDVAYRHHCAGDCDSRDRAAPAGLGTPLTGRDAACAASLPAESTEPSTDCGWRLLGVPAIPRCLPGTVGRRGVLDGSRARRLRRCRRRCRSRRRHRRVRRPRERPRVAVRRRRGASLDRTGCKHDHGGAGDHHHRQERPGTRTGRRLRTWMNRGPVRDRTPPSCTRRRGPFATATPACGRRWSGGARWSSG